MLEAVGEVYKGVSLRTYAEHEDLLHCAVRVAS